MPAIRRNHENRFIRALKNVFSKLISRIRGKSDQSPAEQLGEFANSEQTEKQIEQTARGMVSCVRTESAKSWREAAETWGRGTEIRNALKHEMDGPVGKVCEELVWKNAQYIKTLPLGWAQFVTNYTMREVINGRRPEDVEAELRKILPEHISKNLKCIVRTEMAKANAAITQARAESLGIRAYIWHAANDERTRHSHSAMDGVLVFYDDPPNPEALFPEKGRKPYGNYHAGNTFNCRCWQEPVVDASLLSDVVRVHDHGKIVSMTKAQIITKYGKIA